MSISAAKLRLRNTAVEVHAERPADDGPVYGDAALPYVEIRRTVIPDWPAHQHVLQPRAHDAAGPRPAPCPATSPSAAPRASPRARPAGRRSGWRKPSARCTTEGSRKCNGWYGIANHRPLSARSGKRNARTPIIAPRREAVKAMRLLRPAARSLRQPSQTTERTVPSSSSGGMPSSISTSGTLRWLSAPISTWATSSPLTSPRMVPDACPSARPARCCAGSAYGGCGRSARTLPARPAGCRPGPRPIDAGDDAQHRRDIPSPSGGAKGPRLSALRRSRRRSAP